MTGRSKAQRAAEARYEARSLAVSEITTALAAWRARMGWPQRKAAKALGFTLGGYQQLEWERYLNGTPKPPPLAALLAAAALEAGLSPISPPEK